MNKKCAVYCTTDDNYVFPAIVTLKSVQRFHPDLDLFIIGNQCNITQSKRAFVSECGIKFLHSEKNKFFESDKWPTACYLSLFGPELLFGEGYSYSVGLDADTLCVNPLDIHSICKNLTDYDFAGIENQGPRKDNFFWPDWIQQKYNLSDNVMEGHNTNTGVIFWNNERVANSKLGERAIRCYNECTSPEVKQFKAVDQSLFALISMLENPLQMLVLPRTYNYRVHNHHDLAEDIKETDIRIIHFTGPKPWEHLPLKKCLKEPTLLRARNKWFSFVDELRLFNRDLTIQNSDLVEKMKRKFIYPLQDATRKLITTHLSLINLL